MCFGLDKLLANPEVFLNMIDMITAVDISLIIRTLVVQKLT